MENRKKKLNAFEAMSQAQMLTFYPIVFQAVVAVKRLGILQFLNENKGFNLVEDIAKGVDVSEYGVRILLDMCCKIQVSERNENDEFAIGTVGFFILNDSQTSINLNFVQDVCYKGAFHMVESIKESKPVGLKELGNWDTLYEGLLDLPKHVLKSWLEFDHFYSDNIFKESMKIIFSSSPKSIIDIGGNTGKFIIEVCNHDNDIKATIIDLKQQLIEASKNIKSKGFSDRVTFVEQNILDKEMNFSFNTDVIWMSQFLDCFSEDEIALILNNISKSINKETRILINETFWDNQKFESAEYCLLGTSLYFTSIANGNSRMYSEKTFNKIIEKTNLDVVSRSSLGNHHTLLELRLNN